MCGIAGILSLDSRPVDIALLCRMTDVIKHRGPDDQGKVLINPRSAGHGGGIIEFKTPSELTERRENVSEYTVGLGHRRLSILDLSTRGRQPMSNGDGSLWIVHNGEVYNYLEIREELIAKGYEFSSNTDTEVIINAYDEWGTACLDKFNGMWAFAIWDSKKRRLFCARDRFGVKPFYYYFNGDVFIFASEIKQILEYGGYERRPNKTLIYDYLVIGNEDHTGETFFDDICQLRGGEYAIVDLSSGEFRKERFYNLGGIREATYDERECYERFRDLFFDSVGIRLRSDVPLGSCLSGGLDSSAVVSVMSKLIAANGSDFPVKTFTACWENDVIDERGYAEAIVSFTGARGNYVYPSSEELKQDLSQLIWHQEEPFGSLSIFAQWAVMKAAREQGVPVLLDGQGGDEVFLGYERYYAWFLLELIKRKRLQRFIRELRKGKENSRLSQKEIILFYIYFNSNHVRAIRLYHKTKPYMNRDFVRDYRILDRLGIFEKTGTVFDLQLVEIQDMQLSHLLKYADRNSMAFAIETRLPFLDYRLVEFALSVPSEFKIRDGWTKNVIREGMKGLFPDSIRKRKNKIGFAVSQKALLEAILPELQRIMAERTMIGEYVDEDWLRNKIKTKDVNNVTIWKALCLELWFRTFF